MTESTYIAKKLDASPGFGTRVAAVIAQSEAEDAAGFAEIIGTNRQNVYNWLRREKPTPKALKEILDSVIFVDPNWLETGEGQMRPDATPQSLGAAQIEEEAPADIEDDEMVIIETVSVEAAAGDGAEVGWELVTDRLRLPAWYVREVFGAPPERVKRIRIIGTSMIPTLQPGEYVFIVLFAPGEMPVSGGVYIIRSPFGLLVKRLIYRTETAANDDGECATSYSVTLHSDNEEHGRDTIPLDVFHRDYQPLATLSTAEKAL